MIYVYTIVYITYIYFRNITVPEIKSELYCLKYSL